MRRPTAAAAAVATVWAITTAVPAVAQPPPNDDFDAAVVVDALPFTHATDTSEATAAEDDPDCFGNARSVWYRFTPADAVRVEASTLDSDYDTTLSVWTGPRGDLTALACNDDREDTLQSRVRFDAEPGVTYHIMVAAFGFDAGGALVLDLAETDQPLELDFAHAVLTDAQGQPAGTVAFTTAGPDLVAIAVEVRGLPAGFHGLHIHETGACTPDFGAAGGHLNPTGASHGSHAGDLPAVDVTSSGRGSATLLTDAFTLDDLVDPQRAVIVHAGPDNYAHIPDRYRSSAEGAPPAGPDATTLATGDAGDRIACGVIEAGLGRAITPVEPTETPASAELVDVSGEPLGTVTFAEIEGGLIQVSVLAFGLPAGLHGFHVHATGACRPDFAAADGHLNPAGQGHGEHAGDLPPVLVPASDPFVAASFVTDRFTLTEVTDPPRAVIVHADPDNHAHIPDRYRSSAEGAPPAGPDATTLATGDAGDRIACGVVTPTRPEVRRLAGDSRIETAIAVSQSLYPDPGSASAVVLSRADGFADALAGTALAVARDAPMLLTPTSGLNARTLAEIRRVLPAGGTVYLLGQTSALSAAVAQQVASAGFGVRRIGGTDRFDTAVRIAEELGNPGTVLIAHAFGFADAVAAGAAATHARGVVLLTTADRPHPATDAYLRTHLPEEVFAVGGPAARAYPSARRLAGADRYQTARRVADELFANPRWVGVARGDDFPDALTGGVLLGRLGGPMLLTPPNDLHPEVEDYVCATFPSAAYVFGGERAIAPAVATVLQDRMHGCFDVAPPGELPERFGAGWTGARRAKG